MENKEKLSTTSLGGEDELSGPSKSYRITSRTSFVEQASPIAKPTPYTNVSHYM